MATTSELRRQYALSTKRSVLGDAPHTNIGPSSNARTATKSNAVPIPIPSKATTATSSKPAASSHPEFKGPSTPPPKPREEPRDKPVPPTPPQIIQDSYRSLSFTRVGFLGEGGFARVYEVKDARNARHAVKVVWKEALQSTKAKTKLYAEIKIHRSLRHPNIVNFKDCFEDYNNVYMMLELCECGSLMYLLRRRRRFTEPESRFFMVQIIGACNYLHTNQVIHRDLKLGNLLLDANMNIKVGDFGLAALIERPGERKKTICGTPNYIAPEVLFDSENGHSFEVDIWSIGVILYTFLVGKPPFQAEDKEVRAIYKRIRDNVYDFPENRVISPEAQSLIQQILTRVPEHRPSLYEIVDHPFFTSGTVPSSVPTSAYDSPPNFSHISASASRRNLLQLRRDSWLDDESVLKSTVGMSVALDGIDTTNASKVAQSTTIVMQQQEREFQKAVQPGSPISALLKSAKTPLIVAPPAPSVKEGNLLRKLTAASAPGKSSSLKTVVGPEERPRPRTQLTNIDEGEDEEDAPAPTSRRRAMSANARPQSATETTARGPNGGRTRAVTSSASTVALEAQKARLVSQMAGPSVGAPSRVPSHFALDMDGDRPAPIPKEPLKSSMVGGAAEKAAKINAFDAIEMTLQAAFNAKSAGKLFRDPALDADLPDETVFIVSWVDYCNKYGMGYALTDGSVGVHFNDSTTLVLSPDKQFFDYVISRRQGSVYVRKNYGIDDYPEELKSKAYLLKHFERYMMDSLYGEHGFCYTDKERTKGMAFVQKYLRMKHLIVFKLSHDVLQFNFYDHSKLILSSNGLMITHIDKHYNVTRWKLSEVMLSALEPPSSDPEKQRFRDKLLQKLKYCKEVVTSIRVANPGDGMDGAEGVASGSGGEGQAPATKIRGGFEEEEEKPVPVPAPLPKAARTMRPPPAASSETARATTTIADRLAAINDRLATGMTTQRPTSAGSTATRSASGSSVRSGTTSSRTTIR